MLDILKAIIFGIVEGITEWLPISSTGHLIILEELLQLNQGEAFFEMFQVVIQLGAILAVVVLYFHKLNPFSPQKTQKQKMMTWQIWIKVVIGCVPAGVIGILLDDWIDKVFYHWYVVALMLIVYGVLFIVVENYQRGKEPKATGGRIYILSGNSGHVWRQSAEAGQVRLWIHSNAVCGTACRNGGFLCGIDSGDQIPDELHKEK